MDPFRNFFNDPFFTDFFDHPPFPTLRAVQAEAEAALAAPSFSEGQQQQQRSGSGTFHSSSNYSSSIQHAGQPRVAITRREYSDHGGTSGGVQVRSIGDKRVVYKWHRPAAEDDGTSSTTTTSMATTSTTPQTSDTFDNTNREEFEASWAQLGEKGALPALPPTGVVTHAKAMLELGDANGGGK
jgi:hypothetical protein